MDKVMTQIVKEVRAHAVAHYEQGGWDILVECYDDKDILEAIDGATTVQQAVQKLARILKSSDSYRKDIESTAF